MYIHLDTTNEFIVQAVLTRMREECPEDNILTDTETIFEHAYEPGKGVHVLHYGPLPVFEEISLERWFHLFLASRGARIWTEDDVKTVAPTHAGTIVRTEAGINKIIIDAVYAENRAKLFQSYGVNYIGRTYGDPRTAVLVDYKRDKTHNPTNDPQMKALLTSLPEDKWVSEEPHDWGTFAIVSTSNPDRLAEFMDLLSETDILAYSTGAVAKMKYIGRDYGHIAAPRSDKKYGLEIRETASRMKATQLNNV